MTEMEPPSKKYKLLLSNKTDHIINTIDGYIKNISNSEKNLKAVVSDEYNEPLQLTNVFLGRIKNVKDISKTIQILNEKIPLKSLEHLKRVRRQDIILCPTSQFDVNVTSIQDFIECCAPELREVFEYFKEKEVPRKPPKIDKQCIEARRLWSCNFHPNIYLEKLISDNFFKEFELKMHRKYMEVAFEVSKWYILNKKIDFINSDVFKDINVTVVVDPKLQSIVALSFDNRQVHPMQHSAMLAIDNVAKTQNGGVWNSKFESNCGIPEDVLPYLRDKFPELKIYKNESVLERNESKEGPYLCTGYYIYMLKEPCIMCAMALVHARAQRIFFCIDNKECGALKSKMKLQTIASLNHHFEVFTNFF